MLVEAISKDHAIFSSAAFKPDTTAFNLMLLLKEQPGATVYSNKSDFIAVKSPSGEDIWLWTLSDMAGDRLNEMWQFIHDILPDTGSNIYMKSVVSHSIYLDLPEDRRMFAYHCTKPCELTLSQGNMRKAEPEDSPTLIELMNKAAALGKDASEGKIKNYLENHFPYVWTDSGNSIVAMAVIKRSAAGYMRIGGVFTLPECKDMGYEKSLLHKITEQILEQGQIPMLYAYDTSESAHQLYTSLGYIPCGLISVTKVLP